MCAPHRFSVIFAIPSAAALANWISVRKQDDWKFSEEASDEICTIIRRLI